MITSRCIVLQQQQQQQGGSALLQRKATTPLHSRHIAVKAAAGQQNEPAAAAAAAAAGAEPSRRAVLQWSTLTPLLAALAPVTAAPLSFPAAALAAGGGKPVAELPADARKALQAALDKVAVKTKAPVLLRLVFHDTGTYDAAAGNGGANASIRLELDRPENKGLKRGWRVIEELRAAIKGTPADALVSDADLIALAGAHVVALCGGPAIAVPTGRTDAQSPDPEGRLPPETLSGEGQRRVFAAKGLSTRELVALSGSHSLGSKGYGDPLTFDNEYYRALLAKPWLDKTNKMADMIGIPSDWSLADDAECIPIIKEYAADQVLFFKDFAAAYAKLASLGARWQ